MFLVSTVNISFHEWIFFICITMKTVSYDSHLYETKEEKRAAKERAAAVKASGKKNECTKLYRNKRPGGIPLTYLYQMVVASFRKKDINVTSDSSLLYETSHGGFSYSGSCKIDHTLDFVTWDNLEDYKPNYRLNYENATPNKCLLCLEPGFSTQESKQVHSRPGLAGATHIGNETGNISGPNKSRKSAGLPATYHPLTTTNNNISNAFGYDEESVNRSSGLDFQANTST
ncbi:NRT1/ PTR family 8.2-like protein [Tanacetum coccineum]